MIASDRWLYTCRYCGRPRLPIADPCVWCHGNAARAGLAKIALGTRTRYFGVVGRVEHQRSRLGAMLNFWSRIGHDSRARFYNGKDGLHWIDAGYCLDAPEEMPAGGCVSTFVPDAAEEPDPYLPEQITVRREPPGW